MSEPTVLKQTPLIEWHKSNGGKVVGFAGWELPVQYSGVIPEHRSVRERAGLFDVSHMGEIFVTGPEAEAALQYMTCNDVKSLYDGKAQYSAILNENGGVVDDIIIYRFSQTRYLLCVNASNTDTDFDWLSKKNTFQAEFVNQSAEFGQIALQGPKAEEIFSKICSDEKIVKLSYFHFGEAKLKAASGEVRAIVARTGYTGEDGFELFVPWDATLSVWEALLQAGASMGVTACGLGARDSLRLEACYPLHGHELATDISALESGLGWAVKLDKGEFLGGKALNEEKARGSARALVGFFVDEAGIARQADRVLDLKGHPIGIVTSGTKTPTVNRALGIALIDRSATKLGTEILLEVRGKPLKGHVVKRPFYNAIKK